MAETLRSRIKHAVNAFFNKDPTTHQDLGMSYSYRPDRPRVTRGNERTLMNSIINRIALDVASVKFQHVKNDEEGRYLQTIKSPLNECLTLSGNIDQTGRALIQDEVISMCDEGVVAVLPTNTSADPEFTDSYEIYDMRTAKIMDWYPYHVKMRAYNEKTGKYEDVTKLKRTVAIIENPFYIVMNAPNSTLQRINRKLAFLDAIDEQTSSGKLDILIQLPYAVKNDLRRQQANQRRADIEEQLTGSKYGIAYIDGTERVTQLNRPVENNLLKQIEYLMSMLFSQLNITQSILDGTADEQTMINYQNRTIEPFAAAIADEMTRKFISRTARSQGQAVSFFVDFWKLASLKTIAESADSLCRNEITSSNEIRQKIGFKPSSDPRADQLINKNISHPAEETKAKTPADPSTERADKARKFIQNFKGKGVENQNE